LSCQVSIVVNAKARFSMIPAPINANQVCRWFLVVLLSSLGAPPSAQTRGQVGETPPAGGGPRTPVLVSPEVLPDRRVVVRLYAPQARDVRMIFERGGQPLTRDNDGVWQATLGPLEPARIAMDSALMARRSPTHAILKQSACRW
jgi:hypothetical protein